MTRSDPCNSDTSNNRKLLLSTSQKTSSERFADNHPRTVEKLNVSTEQLQALLSRPVAYNKLLSIAGGSVGAGVFLSQMIYWYEHTDGERDGWIYKTREDWWIETAISRYELETIRKALAARNLIQEKLCGVPAKLHYRLNWDGLRPALAAAIEAHSRRVNKRSAPTNAFQGKDSAGKPVATPPTEGGSATNKEEATPPTIDSSESPAESTTETTKTSGSRSAVKEIVPEDQEVVVVAPLALPGEGEGKLASGVTLVTSAPTEHDSPADVADKLTEKYELSEAQGAQIEAYIAALGLGYVLEKSELTDSEPRDNAGRYLMAALRDDFKAPKRTRKATTSPNPTREPAPAQVPPELTDEQRATSAAALKAIRLALA